MILLFLPARNAVFGNERFTQTPICPQSKEIHPRTVVAGWENLRGDAGFATTKSLLNQHCPDL